MIAAVLLATLRAVAIDSLAALGALCLGGFIIAAVFAWLMRHRRRHHKSTRGYL